ncbi:MAG TPA: hypothetical protein ENJ28_08790, partial [Gammaproteobacteria bacterium]|nr:hypothetical protein [Gammaproteobacteria bacterium]
MEKSDKTLGGNVDKIKSEIHTDISNLKNELEKQIYYLQTDLSISVKPKLKKIDFYIEQVYEFKYELRDIKKRN